MRKIIIICLLVAAMLLGSISSVLAADAAPANAAVATMQVQIDAALGTDTPGAAVIVIEKGQRTVLEGFGYADIEERTLITPETMFPIGDLSSIFVSIAAWHAAEKGTISLDESIETYLPEEVYDKLSLAYPVTVRQLLAGRAGFEGRSFDIAYKKPSRMEPLLADAVLSDVPQQIVAPGTASSNSPFGISLAALVIESASGCSFSDYVLANVLVPLGMMHTVLALSEDTELGENVACGMQKSTDGMFEHLEKGGVLYSGLYPANGAWSTAADMEKLLLWLSSDNKGPIFTHVASSAFGAMTFSNGLFPASNDAGLRVMGETAGLVTKREGFSASLWFCRDGSRAALVLTNVGESTLLELPLTLCGAANTVTAAATEDLPNVKTFEGYYSITTGETHTFRGKLNAAMQAERAVANKENQTLEFLGMTLVQIAPGVFADATGDAGVAAVQFVLDGEGEVLAVYTAGGEAYLPTPFAQQPLPARAMLCVLAFLGIWFLLAGIFATIRYLSHRGEYENYFYLALPYMAASLQALFVIWCALVSIKSPYATSSFVGALGVLLLLFIIAAAASILLAFVASITDSRMNGRMVRTAVMYLAFTILTFVWGLVI